MAFPRLAPLAFVILVAIECSCAAELRVSDFGAIPNDGRDDTIALRKAAEALKAKPGTTLSFAPGRYDLNEGPNGSPSVVFQQCRDLTIDGGGAEFVGHSSGSMLVFVNCDNLVVRGLKVDWDPLPFAGGKVVSVGEKYFDLEIAAPHTAQPGRRVEGVLGYDENRRRLARGGLDLYQIGFSKLTELARPNVLRCFTNGALPRIGDSEIVRHQIYVGNAFTLLHCRKARLDGITVYAAPGMGLYADHCALKSPYSRCVY